MVTTVALETIDMVEMLSTFVMRPNILFSTVTGRFEQLKDGEMKM